MPKYLSIFVWYTLITSTLTGVGLVFYFDFHFGRLSEISPIVKSSVFFHVIYAITVIFIVIFIVSKLTKKRNKVALKQFVSENPAKYRVLFLFLFLANLMYILLIFLLNSKSIPLFMVFNGNGDEALGAAKAIHLASGSYQLPYISKFFDFLNFFLPLLGLLLYRWKSTSLLMLLAGYMLSFLYLSMGLQKAPFLILCLLSMYVFLLINKSYFKKMVGVLFFLVSIGLAIYIYSFFMGKDFLGMLYYLLDRPIFGQIQGMYFMEEYYPPSMDAIFSKMYFSTGVNSSSIPPDVFIVDYVYPNSSHIVNVNTFFIGEAWAFAGEKGVLVFSLVVAASIGLYIYFWSSALKNHVHISFLMALIFFSTLPINQSLQFIMYQKYFMYYLLFFAIPVYLFLIMLKVKK